MAPHYKMWATGQLLWVRDQDAAQNRIGNGHHNVEKYDFMLFVAINVCMLISPKKFTFARESAQFVYCSAYLNDNRPVKSRLTGYLLEL